MASRRSDCEAGGEATQDAGHGEMFVLLATGFERYQQSIARAPTAILQRLNRELKRIVGDVAHLEWAKDMNSARVTLSTMDGKQN